MKTLKNTNHLSNGHFFHTHTILYRYQFEYTDYRKIVGIKGHDNSWATPERNESKKFDRLFVWIVFYSKLTTIQWWRLRIDFISQSAFQYYSERDFEKSASSSVALVDRGNPEFGTNVVNLFQDLCHWLILIVIDKNRCTDYYIVQFYYFRR